MDKKLGKLYYDTDDEDGSSRSLLHNTRSKDKLEKYLDKPVIKTKGSTWYMSMFLVMNSSLTAGVLNIAAAYNSGGGLTMMIPAQMIIVPIMVGSLFILAWCSDINRSTSYEDVVLAICGKRAKIACAAAMVISCFASVVGTFVVIGDQWDKFLTFAYGPTYCRHWYMRRSFTMAVTCTMVALPLSYVRRFDFLKYPSMVGVAAVWYTVLLVTIKYLISGPYIPEAVENIQINRIDVFHAIPVITFCYQCHLSIIPIYACLENRNLTELAKTVFTGMSVVMVAYTSTATFGYLTFGVNINQDILLSYKPVTTEILIALMLIAFKMYTGQPMVTFVGRAAAASVWVYVTNVSAIDIYRYERKRRYTIVSIWFLLALTVATVMPNIGIVLKFLGGFNTIFIFILPGFCLMRGLQTGKFHVIQTRLHYNILLVIAVFYMCFGTFMFGLGITQVLMKSISAFDPLSLLQSASAVTTMPCP